jgi:hypothetical protein
MVYACVKREIHKEFCLRKIEEIKRLGHSDSQWKRIIKVKFKSNRMGRRGLNECGPSQQPVPRFCEHGNKP